MDLQAAYMGALQYMPSTDRDLDRYVAAAIVAFVSACTVFDKPIEAPLGPVCATNRDCTEQLGMPAICVPDTAPRCAALLSDDCYSIPVTYKSAANVDTTDMLPAITGDYMADNAIVIGALFTVTGNQASANVPRNYAAIMAVGEINGSGGIPGPGTTHRPLVLLTCDAQVDPLRAARHLAIDLRVPAIIGGNASQTAYDITKDISAPNGSMLFSPSAIASDIVGLDSHGLTRLMVATDIQRVPVMINEINRLETQLKASRGKSQLRLAVYYRNDLTGTGTNVGLAQRLQFNGQTVNSNIVNHLIRTDGYDPTIATMTGWIDRATINAYTTTVAGDPASPFMPDIIVLAGASEATAGFLAPLDEQWAMPGSATQNLPKPYYIAIDANKNQNLLTKIASNNDLRLRIRGTGVLTGSATDPPGSVGRLSYQAYQAFQFDYTQTYPNQLPTLAQGGGMAQTYDSVYAVAFSLAYARAMPPTGETVAAHLPNLYMVAGNQTIQIGESGFLPRAFSELAAGRSVAVIGSFGSLQWDATGAKASGLVETWCVKTNGAVPLTNLFASSGLTFDVNSQTFAGQGSYPGDATAMPPVPYTTPAACSPSAVLPN